MASSETSGKTTAENAWFILHFETTDQAVRQQCNVLVNTFPSLPIKEALVPFTTTIHEAFNKLGDLYSGGGWTIRTLYIIGRDGKQLATNPTQIMDFLRDLPSTALETTKPDLLGLGTNRVRVEFGDIDITPWRGLGRLGRG